MNIIEEIRSYLGDSITEIMNNMTAEEIAHEFAWDVQPDVSWTELLTAVYYIQSRKGKNPILIRRQT